MWKKRRDCPNKEAKPPAVAIRVNPDVQAGGHPHIATGRHEHKFGLDWAEAKRLYLMHRNSKWIRWQGISAHIGSQITTLIPFRRALARLAGFVGELRRAQIDLRYLDVGGGLGVRYSDQKPPTRTEYARLVSRMVRKLGVHLLLEPGRSIIAPASVLLTRVVYTKTNRGKTFVIVDSAMNDLMRPALYGAVHPITKVTRERNENSILAANEPTSSGQFARRAIAFCTIGRSEMCRPAICLLFGSPEPMAWPKRQTTTRDVAPLKFWWKGIASS